MSALNTLEPTQSLALSDSECIGFEENAVSAMKRLEAAMHQYAPENGESAPRPVVN